MTKSQLKTFQLLFHLWEGKTVKYFKAFIERNYWKQVFFSILEITRVTRTHVFLDRNHDICLYKLHDDVSPVYSYNGKHICKISIFKLTFKKYKHSRSKCSMNKASSSANIRAEGFHGMSAGKVCESLHYCQGM